MGNDGGSIPTRRELVKEAARNPTATELKDKQKEHLAHRWSICPVSHRPLVKPVVSDSSGDLYNKDAIIQFLLPTEVTSIDKEEYEKHIQGRVRSLKDLVEVQFQVEQDEKTKTEKWVCPVTSKEFGPNVKAVYLVPCGHAFSQEAIKEMKSDGKCVECSTEYEERDVVPILPSTDQDKAFVVDRIEKLRALGLTHALKKSSSGKKRKANGDTKGDVAVSAITENSDKVQALEPNRTLKTPNGTKAPSAIKNSATASLTARVLEEEEARKKKKRANDNISSLYAKKSADGSKKNGDFMTRGFTIPANARHG